MLFELLLSVPAAVAAGYIGIKMFCPWILEDFKYICIAGPTIATYERMSRNRQFIIDHFEQKVHKFPDRLFLLYEDQKFTYKQANEYVNKFGRTFLSLGLRQGDTVALMQYNCPDFVWTFLGCLKCGMSVSLINTNLRGKALVHCISVSETNTVLVGNDEDLLSAIEAVLPDLPNATIYVLGSSSNIPATFISLQSKMCDVKADDIDSSQYKGKASDAAAFIFTSGTTGLPKAATMSQRRLLASYSISTIAGIRQDDVVYVTLPLYHSSALVVGLCSVICYGATCALGKKFSKSGFWSDVRKHKATVFIYIGEMCRYLLTNDKTDQDKDNAIRLSVGNGLRQDIFAEFKNRFGIPRICEFYASTEGVAGFININNVVGACGRSSPFLERFVSCGLFQWDVENECLKRDKNGFCVPVEKGKPGLLLMEINKKQPFDGYKGNKQQSESKIVRNVRRQGDMYFNSGDLMSKDKDYNVYFNDRVGDTFRWKGENVSTTEVSNLLTDLSFVIDASVYGVTVPGCDGKAGMATLLISPDVGKITEKQLSEISSHCHRVLPVYAIPLFLRIKWEELDMTSTIKQSKVKLKQEGFDFSQIGDPLFYYERSSRSYKRLIKEVHEDIMNQTIRF